MIGTTKNRQDTYNGQPIFISAASASTAPVICWPVRANILLWVSLGHSITEGFPELISLLGHSPRGRELSRLGETKSLYEENLSSLPRLPTCEARQLALRPQRRVRSPNVNVRVHRGTRDHINRTVFLCLCYIESLRLCGKWKAATKEN